MDDVRITWWMVVLVAIGVAGLAVWQSSRWTLKLRAGAGLLGLFYFGLLAVAIGGDPRGGTPVWRLAEVLNVALGTMSIVAAALLSGRPAPRGQLIWFAVMSLSNAGLCLGCGAMGIAAGLLAVSLGTLALVGVQCRLAPMRTEELWPGSPEERQGETIPTAILASITGLMVAVVLIGAIHYALHAESTRATPTRRHSALPSRARIRSSLNIRPEEERATRLIDIAFGRRADMIVLFGVLALMTVGMAVPKPTPSDQPAGD